MYVGAVAARNTNIVISPRIRSISPAFMLIPANPPVEKGEGVSFTSGKRWTLKHLKSLLEKDAALISEKSSITYVVL